VGTFEIRRAADRLSTRTEWLDSRHSFSFGHEYDPDNTRFGVLIANNDDVLAPGTGFDAHPHRDLEIVTWVTEGSLVHQDSKGNSGVLYPGLAQRISAGAGIMHSERNDAWRSSDHVGDGSRPVRYVQMWVTPDESGLAPSYAQIEVGERLACGELVPLASGLARHRDQTALRIHQRGAGLYAARLPSNHTVQLPAAPFVHVFLVRGAIVIEGIGELGSADSARIDGADGERMSAITDSEVLVWEMHTSLGPGRS
jgi:redox-sensitive bicupin YhaK (pirin superfamily)